ncbi:MAG: outer membrane protein assembly factor BamA [Pseudomonadota bacterium]
MRVPAFLPVSSPRACAVALFLAGAALPALAVAPFTLKDIRVEGLQRTEAGTVFASLPFRVGDTYSDEKGAAALRALFASGLFKDVRIEIDGAVAVIVVEERSVVGKVDFTGTSEFDRETLLKALKDIGVAEGQPFDKAQADRAEQELKRQYLTRSLYGAEVVTTITPVDRNRVNVTFAVTEGGIARIREIRITGNEAFSEGTLLSQLDLTTGGLMTWYTKSDRYSRAKLNADLETLRAWYLNRGYLEFNVESTQVAISPDKQDISITINIREGQRYTVTGVKISGDYLGKDEEFRSLVTIRPGEPYRAEDVESTQKAFSERFGLFGHAFARVELVPRIDRDTGRVEIQLNADPGKRVYVRRINVSGNTKTRDEVIRREFRQFESAWYDGRRIKLSRDRVDRLGYFSEVDIETQEVPGTADQVDLTINVKEKPTGSLMLGANFSSADKLGFTGSIKQDNVFGSGNYLGIDLNTSKSSRTLVLSNVNPYFTQDGVSRSLDVYYRTNKPVNSQGESYELVTPGASVRFGVPFSDFDTVFFGIGAERTTMRSATALPEAYYRYRATYGTSSTSFPLTLGWQRDGRDSSLVPNSGLYQRVNIEWAAFGDTRYVRNNYQIQQYFPLSKKLTLGLNAEVGYAKGLGGRAYPVFKNFYGGGLGTVRAFDQNSLGPIDVTGAYLGGTQRINLNSELYFPFPGVGNDRTLRIFGYFDTGNVWGEDETPTLASFRASAGLGLSWISPIGPLKLSWGQPVRKFSQDRIQRFQFQIGTAF